MKSTDYLGMIGEGATLREAKQDAMRKIEEAIGADYTPTVLAFRSSVICIWRTPTGYCSSFIRDGKTSGVCTYPASDDLASIKGQCLYHLAQAEWNGEEDESPLLTDCEKRQADFRRWVQWQRDYKTGKAQGMTDHDAFVFAWNCR